MTTLAQKNLVRKQFLISESNIVKLNELATKRNTSAADVVRLAIDAYDPLADIEMPELMELVGAHLKEAIESTKKANRKISKTLKILDNKDLH
ncbi:MAG: hypothetical protein COA74_14830 [Gammaproteobacteria bacterium]|nr:MAG: hypothetical protein COA74_14830 [Gammaproteobacteria bacterium]